MFEFAIRRATQRDFAVIMRLMHALLGEMYALNRAALFDQGEAWRDFEMRLWQALPRESHDAEGQAGAPDHLLEIADHSGSDVIPIGLIEASVLCPVPRYRLESTLQIHAVYVLADYRCHGVGTALLHSALAWGRQNHCQQAQLSVLPHNPARRLYQALGFTIAGVVLRHDLTGLPV